MRVRSDEQRGDAASDHGLPPGAERVIATLDARAFGVAVGTVAAAVILLATLILVNRGGDVVGPNLGLLSQYFVGYSVTVAGAVVGSAYAFALGFLVTYWFARLRDVFIRTCLRLAWHRAQRRAARDLLDHLT